MTDHVDIAKRSAIMAAVQSKNSKPEIAVRKLVHGMGYRFRLHGKGLVGHPDLVFAGRRKVVFVHGCFWHRHDLCPKASLPKTRPEFWQQKFDANVSRDERTERALIGDGWKVLTVWQCELKDTEKLARRLNEFLKD
jgi:DNA mismatch endonuclease (patch repair protein)